MTTDYEQREARRRKILQNQKSRMEKILELKGTTREPSIDGLAPRSDGDIPAPCTESPKIERPATVSPSSPSSDDLYSPLGSPPPHCLTPHLPWYRRPRCTAALLLGISWRLLLAIVTLPNHLASVAVPCLLLTITFELLASVFAATGPGGWPSHGHLVNFLLSFGFSDSLVLWAGKVADAFSRLANDALLVVIGFLVVHLVLD